MRTGIVRATIVCVLKLAGSAAIAMPPGGPPPNDNCGGAIALIPRGTCSFEEKLINAGAAGAVAGIVYNNADG